MTPIELRPKMSARYLFERVSKKTGERQVVAGASNNLLLENFFRIALSQTNSSPERFVGRIVVGSGTTPPTEADLLLESFLASSSKTTGTALSPTINSTEFPRYMTRRVIERINGSAIAGAPLSEVGITMTGTSTGTANSTTPLMSRALIRDPNGNPTSITVLADEFLDVTWEYTTYALDGVTGSFDINVLGTVETFNYEIRPISMLNNEAWKWNTNQNNYTYLATGNFPMAIGSVNSLRCWVSSETEFRSPSDTSFTVGSTFSGHVQDPVWDELTKTATGILNLPLGSGNVGGIRSIFLNFSQGTPTAVSGVIRGGGYFLGAHQMLLDKPIPKNEERVFQFPITMGMSNATPPGV